VMDDVSCINMVSYCWLSAPVGTPASMPRGSYSGTMAEMSTTWHPRRSWSGPDLLSWAGPYCSSRSREGIEGER
jgi:hypothetical protein